LRTSKNTEKGDRKQDKIQAKEDLEKQMEDLEVSAAELKKSEEKASVLNKLKGMLGDKHKKFGGVNFEAPVSLINVSENHRMIDSESEDFIALKESINNQGLIQRPIVTLSENIDQPFLCIAGHRRIQAIKELGFEKIPIIIGDYSDRNSQDLARLAENVVRQSLKPVELAEAVFRLKGKLGETNSGIARILNKHRGYIIVLLKIAEWPQSIKDLIIQHEVGMHFLNSLAKKAFSIEQVEIRIKKHVSVEVSNSSTLKISSNNSSINSNNSLKMNLFFEKNKIDRETKEHIQNFLNQMKIKGWYQSDKKGV
jgi:ParB/RepB/Spo0J family partition protein